MQDNLKKTMQIDLICREFSGTVFYTPVVVKPLPWYRSACLVRRIFLPHFVQITILVEDHVGGTVLTVGILHCESVHVPVSITYNINHSVGRIALDSCAANTMQKGVERRPAFIAQPGYKQHPAQSTARQAPSPLPKYVRDYTHSPAVYRLNMQN